MANQNISRNNIRIPNLPMGKIVDANGMPTDDEMTFRQTLLTLLQQFIGNEGLVMPSQTQSNIALIQNNTAQAQGATPSFTYTCAYGTMIYNSSPYDAMTNPGGNGIQVAVEMVRGNLFSRP